MTKVQYKAWHKFKSCFMPHTSQSQSGPHNPRQAENVNARATTHRCGVVYTGTTLTNRLHAQELHTLQLGTSNQQRTQQWPVLQQTMPNPSVYRHERGIVAQQETLEPISTTPIPQGTTSPPQLIAATARITAAPVAAGSP